MVKQPLPQLFFVTSSIRSLLNVGALFRCCDTFGVTKLYLTGITGKPPRQEISKTALGAEQTVPWEYHRQALRLLKQLKSEGVRIVALEITRKSIPLPQYQPTFPLALIVGHEIRGVSRAVLRFCDDVVAIPMLGQKESLNVAVAASVALYALRYGVVNG